MTASLDQMSDDEILSMRFCDLELNLEQSFVKESVAKVLNELKESKLQLQPRVYFGDEWFSPEGVVAISIPFYLAHPRLTQLHKKYLGECEGETHEEFCKLLRHELGHAFDHAFEVSKRPTWRKIFGSPTKHYNPDVYRPRPYSRNYVKNLAHYYAQSHPDEDFAESFAVWLNPQSNWKQNYEGWGALRKLSYVDRLSREFEGRPHSPARGRMISDTRQLHTSLKNYYEKRKRLLSMDHPAIFDADLEKIFVCAEGAGSQKAHRFIALHRDELIENLSHWTGERKIQIKTLLRRVIERAKQLSLSLSAEDDERVLLQLSIFLSSIISNYRLTGKFKGH